MWFWIPSAEDQQPTKPATPTHYLSQGVATLNQKSILSKGRQLQLISSAVYILPNTPDISDYGCSTRRTGSQDLGDRYIHSSPLRRSDLSDNGTHWSLGTLRTVCSQYLVLYRTVGLRMAYTRYDHRLPSLKQQIKRVMFNKILLSSTLNKSGYYGKSDCLVLPKNLA